MGYFAKVGTISRGTPETRAAVGQIDPDLLGVENATPSCPDLTSADRSGSNSFESTPMVVTWTLENIPALRTKMRQCSQLRKAEQCAWLLLFRPRAAMNLPSRVVSSRSNSSRDSPSASPLRGFWPS